MNPLILVLRLLHIVSGAFWVGTIITTVFFIEPTAKALGGEGERFVAYLAIRRGLVVVLVIAATTAIAAGALLYWIDSGGLRLEWITSHTGLGFTAGALAALSAFAIVPIFFRPEADRLTAVAAGRITSTDSETNSQRDERERSERRFRRWSLIQVSLLIFAIAAMATARYLP
jgi:hypothetical protein